jgi:hypothetical protein
MSCCNSRCIVPSNFKITCTSECTNNLSSDNDGDNVNYIDVLFIGVTNGNHPSNPSFNILNTTLKTIPFNTPVDSFGTAISLQSDGSFLINESGLYEVSYEVTWNTIQWEEGDADNFASGFRSCQIIVNPNIVNASQVYGSNSILAENDDVFIYPYTQDGSSVIRLNKNDIVIIQAYAIMALADGITSCITDEVHINQKPGFVTRVQINKLS